MTRTIILLLAGTALAFGQQAYKKPPEAILRVLNAPATPVANVNPPRTHLLLLEPDRYPPIAELAEPMLRLAGLRINPRNNGTRGGVSYRKAELIDLTTLRRTVLAIPAGVKIGVPQWSADGNTAALLAYRTDRIDVMILDAAAGALRVLTGVRANAAYGDPLEWLADGKRLLVRTVAAGRGPAPREAAVPLGPDIQESFGKAAPAPTFQDLLKSEHDEKLFDYYCASQAVIVDLSTGRVTNVGRPGIFSSLRPSPDGAYLLAQRLRRPYSWVLPAARFPVDMEVWRMDGTLARQVAALPLADRIPIDGVRTGPRNLNWRPGQPATLVWWEAMDGGNPKEKVPHRDRMMMAEAPFDQPREFTKLEERLQGFPVWTSDGRLWVNETERRTRRQRTFLVGADGTAAELASRNSQDSYRDMGTPVALTEDGGSRVARVEGGSILLTGTGATPTGDRPFLDRMDLSTRAKTRLFVSGEGVYETVVAALTADGTRLLTRRESPSEPPNYYLIDNTAVQDRGQQMRHVLKTWDLGRGSGV